MTTSPERCEALTCPLNEAGIIHSQGIYKHNNQDNVGFCIVFANSNPPDFIWKAWERYADLERIIKKGKHNGENVEELVKEREAKSQIVERFLDYHCGCNRCLEGGKH